MASVIAKVLYNNVIFVHVSLKKCFSRINIYLIPIAPFFWQLVWVHGECRFFLFITSAKEAMS